MITSEVIKATFDFSQVSKYSVSKMNIDNEWQKSIIRSYLVTMSMTSTQDCVNVAEDFAPTLRKCKRSFRIHLTVQGKIFPIGSFSRTAASKNDGKLLHFYSTSYRHNCLLIERQEFDND